jgi:hypothetical protein
MDCDRYTVKKTFSSWHGSPDGMDGIGSTHSQFIRLPSGKLIPEHAMPFCLISSNFCGGNMAFCVLQNRDPIAFIYSLPALFLMNAASFPGM